VTGTDSKTDIEKGRVERKIDRVMRKIKIKRDHRIVEDRSMDIDR